MTRTAPRVLVTCATFEPGFRGGGPVRSVGQIIDSVSGDMDITLVTSDRDLGSPQPYPGLSGTRVARGRATVAYINTRNPLHWIRWIRETRRDPPSLLYLNSLWHPWFTLLPVLLHAIGLMPAHALLIAPRGELSQGALSIKARKKRMAMTFLRPVLERLNVSWHASSELEAAEIRSTFRNAAVYVYTNLDPTALDRVVDFPPPTRSDQARFVFIGRISVKKNLDHVIDALATVRVPASLDVFGPLEDKRYWATCQDKIAKLPNQIHVAYRGELAPDEVPLTFSKYDAFVFPTLGENFGHVIAESLASFCPVICWDTTPWTPVLENGGGEVVRDPSAVALGQVLTRWATRSPEQVEAARSAAAAAFRQWHSEQDRTNILDVAMQRIGAGA
jgi:glycosyltransferase involved in cell wall biosynthesis